MKRLSYIILILCVFACEQADDPTALENDANLKVVYNELLSSGMLENMELKEFQEQISSSMDQLEISNESYYSNAEDTTIPSVNIAA